MVFLSMLVLWKREKITDLYLWNPGFFGVKVEIVIKGGMIAWSQMGDANTSIPTLQVVHTHPIFGSSTDARHVRSFTLISQAGLEK